MECNKDEAERAKEIAERKANEKNYGDAKKFALKAQNLFPRLEGLSQLLTTLDVYIAAGNRITGEIDWYGILGVDPEADDETVKKQYRKLAFTLHPDKNKSQGADGAFKWVSEAWSLLSDKAKRSAYNQRRNLRGPQRRVHVPAGVPSAPPHANGFQRFGNRESSSYMNQGRTTEVSSSSVHSSSPESNTFWTICNRCKTHYEYLRVYQNQMLICPNCHKAFHAEEKDPPKNIPKPTSVPPHQQNENLKHHHTSNRNPYNSGSGGSAGLSSFNNSNLQSGTFSRQAGFGSTGANDKMQSESNAYQKRSNSATEVDRLVKKVRADDQGRGGHTVNQMTMRSGPEIRRGDFKSEIAYGSYGVNCRTFIRELSFSEIRNMLIGKARTEIHNKLAEWKNKKYAVETDKKDFVPASIHVPDSDFYKFDLDRDERAFATDQIWAAYDADDGMPRYYARIHKVTNLKPFRMRISWLNSRSNTEIGPMNWIGSGFVKTVGEFRVGRYEPYENLNSFSHRVQSTKGARGVICIYPQKGDVWALYQNWSPDWNELTPDEVRHKYEMVEVIEDYEEEQGVAVSPLIKVTGFRAVFHKHMDPKEVRRIPKEELFRFSHQVPNYLLTGKESPNAPKGCRELDPAATPDELLKVITEAYEPTEAANYNV